MVLYSRKILAEKSVVTNLVLAYLQNCQFYWEEDRPVIYMDETYFQEQRRA
jgi:hypothetical protein